MESARKTRTTRSSGGRARNRNVGPGAVSGPGPDQKGQNGDRIHDNDNNNINNDKAKNYNLRDSDTVTTALTTANLSSAFPHGQERATASPNFTTRDSGSYLPSSRDEASNTVRPGAVAVTGYRPRQKGGATTAGGSTAKDEIRSSRPGQSADDDDDQPRPGRGREGGDNSGVGAVAVSGRRPRTKGGAVAVVSYSAAPSNCMDVVGGTATLPIPSPGAYASTIPVRNKTGGGYLTLKTSSRGTEEAKKNSTVETAQDRFRHYQEGLTDSSASDGVRFSSSSTYDKVTDQVESRRRSENEKSRQHRKGDSGSLPDKQMYSSTDKASSKPGAFPTPGLGTTGETSGDKKAHLYPNSNTASISGETQQERLQHFQNGLSQDLALGRSKSAGNGESQQERLRQYQAAFSQDLELGRSKSTGTSAESQLERLRHYQKGLSKDLASSGTSASHGHHGDQSSTPGAYNVAGISSNLRGQTKVNLPSHQDKFNRAESGNFTESESAHQSAASPAVRKVAGAYNGRPRRTSVEKDANGNADQSTARQLGNGVTSPQTKAHDRTSFGDGEVQRTGVTFRPGSGGVNNKLGTRGRRAGRDSVPQDFRKGNMETANQQYNDEELGDSADDDHVDKIEDGRESEGGRQRRLSDNQIDGDKDENQVEQSMIPDGNQLTSLLTAQVQLNSADAGVDPELQESQGIKDPELDSPEQPVDNLISAHVVDEDALAQQFVVESEAEIRKQIVGECVQAMVVTEEEEEERPRWKRYGPCIAFIVIAVIIAAVVSTVVGPDEGTLPPTMNTEPTASPSAAPTLQDIDYARILATTVSNEDDLTNETTSQFKALNWLVFEDPLMLEIQSTSQEELLNRYICAVLYFSTSGPDQWVDQLNFLTNSTVCEWTSDQASLGIQCDKENYVNGINLVGNDLNGTIPAEISFLTRLEVLKLSKNSLFGSIPDNAGELARLHFFEVDENMLTGSVPDAVGDLNNIENMSLASNLLTGTIPAGMTTIGALEYLFLQNNSFNGSIPDFGAHMGVLEVRMDHNQLSGPVPDSLTSLEDLLKLDLSHNKFNGAIPRKIGSMKNLEELHLNDNEFSGTLPTENRGIASLDRLNIMDLQNNLIAGNIPSVLGDLIRLVQIDLSHNRFVGTLPRSLGTLPNLRVLRVTDNEIGGSVPSSYGDLSNLAVFDISSTSITGSVNSIFCSSGNSVEFELTADCGGSPPEVNCTCCTFCCEDTTGECQAIVP